MNSASSAIAFDLGPIIYFYTHSLLVVALTGVMFMGLGIWFGWLTWARFKRRARAYQEECDLLRHEIAALKRRISARTVGPASPVLINEDAPVPAVDEGPALPGFDVKAAGKADREEVNPVAHVFAAPVKDEPEIWQPHVTKDSLAAAVLGVNGAHHHTLEPIAPPDSIVELPAEPASPPVPPLEAANGSPSPLTLKKPADPRAAAPLSNNGSQVKAMLSAKAAAARNGAGAASTSPRPAAEPSAPAPTPELKAEAAAPEPVPAVELPVQPQEEPPPPAAVAEDTPAHAAFATELASGMAVADDKLGILMHSQPDRWDDLTLLRGVGEILQQRLHDSGVHTFKQIAYWTEGNVDEFSSRIEARDRIRREGWIRQARDLHFLKYGEKLAG